jgi:hypothetical protein
MTDSIDQMLVLLRQIEIETNELIADYFYFVNQWQMSAKKIENNRISIEELRNAIEGTRRKQGGGTE